MSGAARIRNWVLCLMAMAVLLPAMAWAETFKIKTVAKGPGRIVGTRSVEQGGELTFSFTPKGNVYEVREVIVDGDSKGAPTEYTFSNVTENHKLTVIFRKKTFAISATIWNDQGGGAFRPAGDLKAVYGSSKVFRAKPFADAVASLSVDGTLVREGEPGKAISYKLKRITDNHTVVARFGQAGGNHPPAADSISQAADPAVPYAQIQLTGSDPDSDTLSYDLVGPDSGNGYDLAYVNPESGELYVSLTANPDPNANPTDAWTVELPYRVSDGQLYSAPATVSILVKAKGGDKGTGGQTVDPQTYAGFDKTRLSSNLLGAPGGAPTEPPSVDLSSSFPTPGDQGQQGSCVAWATGYALKSYQEGVEMKWSLNTTSHLFSPAFIYNQVNGGQDGGSQIYDALDLIIAKGAATWDLMPYTDQNFTDQPSAEAMAEAAKFKGLKRYTLSTLSDLKGALAQRKPVVLGIDVYDQFYNLKGPDSVYNSKAGNNNGPHGKHAVTAVGYDNNKYGGAVKVINSWSTNWGDNGFFWMPYSFFPEVTFQMWVLDDGPNDNVNPTPDPVPPPSGKLPDLQIASWSANLDYSIGGKGELEYKVVNGGEADAPIGTTVAFLLSTDIQITPADTYVVYESFDFSLAPGHNGYRSIAGGNGISFDIPADLEPGDYYLGLLVDDMNAITESDETNNSMPSIDVGHFANNSSDLEVYTWYANWDDFTGAASLTYRIDNIGGATAPGGWEAALLLSQSENLSSPIVLARDDTFNDPLPAGNYYYRDGSFQAPSLDFNVYTDVNGQGYPAGYYYMAFVADSSDVVSESDELNNYSYSNSWFYNPGSFGAQRRQLSLPSQLGFAGIDQTAAAAKKEAYNGRILPDKLAGVRRVRIHENADGVRTMELLPQSGDGARTAKAQSHKFSKTLHAADQSVFPTVNRKPLPPAAAQ
ncbi:MAG: hypothetical protein FIA97_18500 [Methylococcaceae bacterium]|nr:hypothetical protein [Methylococcaceae bacterium]